MRELADHILTMADDPYLCGHPEWREIVREAESRIAAPAALAEIDRICGLIMRSSGYKTEGEWLGPWIHQIKDLAAHFSPIFSSKTIPSSAQPS